MAPSCVALRVANRGDEPEGMNWWLVTWIVVGLAYTVAGTALLTRRGRRLLGGCFVVVGLAAMIMAVATQYSGYAETHAGTGWTWITWADRWARPLGTGVLVGLVPWLLLAPPWRQHRAGAAGVVDHGWRHRGPRDHRWRRRAAAARARR